MDIYNLGDVTSTTDGRGAFFHSFDIYGVHGRPIVSFSFETRQEADAAHTAMRDIVAKAKLITPHSP
jgi:hypothetical protein